MASCSNRRDGKMRNSGGDVSETDLLLHPELLSRDFLKLVLHEKKIQTDDSEDPDHLTELYIQHVIPLPQRELPKNRWGKRIEKTNPRQSSSTAHSSSTDSGRKRPLIVFDGSSTKTGSIKLKRADDLPVTDRLKSPPSNTSLCYPIRKVSGSSPNSSLTRASAGSARSPTGNGSLNSSSSASPVQSSCMSTKLKRGASNSGVPESPELKSPEVKKKIQHVTWP
ncbi:ashwin [Clarias magur]|uniref:Ashwin n=1 Tax=Clarias magur TaxID=1594786 RepID=A0A8J4U9Y0_CLAMG|nr:ashwin [Clarias magur]